MAKDVSPGTVECPACFAPVGKACTVPTDTTRRAVNWFHLARETKAKEEDR